MFTAWHLKIKKEEKKEGKIEKDKESSIIHITS